ncbi:MAG: chemotaxis protein CheW [Pirellulaceae bacterium]|nr:chemotaxis protein CheW [Pirellulaceae bacterium]
MQYGQGNQLQPNSATGTPGTNVSPDDGMSEEQDPELIAEFVSESIQGLQDIESDLLTLESDGGSDSELVNRIFRTVHTIKGSGGYLKLKSLVAVAHRAETLLDNIRFGSQAATPTVTDAILAAVDTIEQMLSTADLGETFDYAPAVEKLDVALGKPATGPATQPAKAAGDGQASANAQTQECLSEADVKAIKAAISGRALVFRVEVDLARILQAVDVKEGLIVALSSIGKVLYANQPTETIDKATSGSCIIYLETVLEKDILCDFFNLDPATVTVLDVDALTAHAPSTASPSSPSPTSTPTSNKSTPQKSPSTNSTSTGSPAAVATKSSTATSSTPEAALTEASPKANATTSASKVSDADKQAKAEHNKAVVDQSMRVPVHILHKLLEWTGTMVMARNQLMNEFDFNGNTAFRTLSQAISGVHETVIETRMQTTGSLFERYRRVVRDLARQLGKEVALHIEGGDLELDRTILESFADPLTHLIRNSLDHALETPAEREAAGKNRQGNIYLKSFIHSGEIILAIEDDGRGISGDRVCEKAVSKGMITAEAASQMTEQQKVMLIFQAGFSTKDQATDLSGRGVGMDVVRTNIEAVGGSIDVQTKVGSGSTFSAILPLAKALVSSSLTKALIVDIAHERFAIPETAVSEIIRFDERAKANIVQVDGENVYQLRDQLVALVDLKRALDIDADGSGDATDGSSIPATGREHNPCLVVLQYRKHLFGAVVEEVTGIQEIIVRGTPKLLQNCIVYSGHTVLGNGRVSLILDINGIVNKLSLKFHDKASQAKGIRPIDPRQISSKKRTRQKMVVFSFAEGEYFAIPLELVAIIERISLSSIRTVGNKEYCQIKNDTISVMRLDAFLPISPMFAGRDDCCLIRPAAISYPIGILTGPDVSVVEVDDNFESRLDDERGVVGTFVHNDHLVMLLDLFSVFEKHAPDKMRPAEVSTGIARILVAEDSLFFRKLISQYMQQEQWTVDIVCDGLEAWEQLQNEPTRYNLVISDINMPRMDGFQLAARIREDRRFDGLPLVALTTLSEEHFREKGLSLGFDKYVIKIDKNQVRATVAECLQIVRKATVR